MSNIRMYYTKMYDDMIVLKYGVKLEGWPFLTMKNPGDYHTMAEVQKLLDAVKGGACRWVRLTHKELDEYHKDLEEEVARGEREALKWQGPPVATMSNKRKHGGSEKEKKGKGKVTKGRKKQKRVRVSDMSDSRDSEHYTSSDSNTDSSDSSDNDGDGASDNTSIASNGGGVGVEHEGGGDVGSGDAP
jgi:hypothetical protein